MSVVQLDYETCLAATIPYLGTAIVVVHWIYNIVSIFDYYDVFVQRHISLYIKIVKCLSCTTCASCPMVTAPIGEK